MRDSWLGCLNVLRWLVTYCREMELSWRSLKIESWDFRWPDFGTRISQWLVCLTNYLKNGSRFICIVLCVDFSCCDPCNKNDKQRRSRERTTNTSILTSRSWCVLTQRRNQNQCIFWFIPQTMCNDVQNNMDVKTISQDLIPCLKPAED
jgi:hypothetical protein